MRFRRDLETTVTGYRWLDKFTEPYWWWRERRAQRQLYRVIGQGDIKRGERIFRAAVFQMHLNDVASKDAEKEGPR